MDQEPAAHGDGVKELQDKLIVDLLIMYLMKLNHGSLDGFHVKMIVNVMV